MKPRRAAVPLSALLPLISLDADLDHKDSKSNLEQDLESRSLLRASSPSCSTCSLCFDKLDDFRSHFKSESHVDKLKVLNREDAEEPTGQEQRPPGTPFFILRRKPSHSYEFYKAIFTCNPEQSSTISPIKAKEELQAHLNSTWACFLIGSGRFSGAIFDNATGKSLCHKTFRRYTTRHKQGGAQSSADNSTGSSRIRSAGAFLRRHNEQALVKEVHDLLLAWKEDLGKCRLVFWNSTSFGQACLFDGHPPILQKSEPRIRTYPFTTFKSSYEELARCYSILTHAYIIDE